MRLKTKSSARLKKRYLLLHAENKDIIEKVILDYIGILGWARASPLFVDTFKPLERGKLVLAIDRKELENVRAAIELSKQPIKILKVSGTLNGVLKL